jgi:hypothetical protein
MRYNIDKFVFWILILVLLLLSITFFIYLLTEHDVCQKEWHEEELCVGFDYIDCEESRNLTGCAEKTCASKSNICVLDGYRLEGMTKLVKDE